MSSIKQNIFFAIKNNKVMYRITGPIRSIIKHRLEAQVVRHPLRRFDRQHRIYYDKPLDLENPRTLYEKICFLEFCTDTSLQTACTDKVAVRDYITGLGLADILNPVYHIFDDEPTIDELDRAMPQTCVVKTANSGGGESVFVVNEKTQNTAAEIHPGLISAIHDNYGERTGQPHYIGIRPRVIVEKLIVNDKAPGQPPNDYKLFCINGEPVLFNAIGDRNLKTHNMLDQFFDLDWNPLGPDTCASKERVSRPDKIDSMIATARILARPFPFVRVDFYESEGQLIFGELTFTPGFDNFIGRYGEKVMHLGDMLDISNVKKTRQVSPEWF